MTNAAVDVALRLRLDDRATPALDNAARRAMENERKGAEASEQAQRRMRAGYQATSQAREVLGVRSEQRIRREIAATEAAYKRLASTGKLSATEQARALDATRAKVTALTNEMGKLTAAQEKAARGANMQQYGGMAVAAGAAGYMALRGPVQQAMGFEERLGLMANTAYAEYDSAGRKVGERQLREAVKQAVAGGLTADSAAGALDKLIKDNQVGGVKGAMELLPFIAKASVGSGSDPQAVAAMMGSFIGSGYAKSPAEAKRMMGMATAAATAGAFEKEDMAKHLPSLLPLAKLSGLTGEAGMVKVLTLLQQARTTAGSSDEAAVNVRNLLTKITSVDTAKDFEKAGRGDLAKHLMDQRAKGVDPLTAWQNVIDAEIAKNPNLKPAMAKLKAAKTPEEQEAAVQALKGLAEGQSIGKYFQDMQARSALFGLRDKDMEGKVGDAVRSLSGSIIDRDASYMTDKAGVKTRIAGESVKLAQGEALEGPLSGIGQVADRVADLAQKFPLMTGATVTATGAIAAMAGAAGLASLVMGGGRGGAGAAGGGATGRAAGRALPYVMQGGQLLMRGGAAGAALGVGGLALDAVTDEGSAINRYGSSAMTGAALGATAGSFVPVIGTAIGAGVGALGGLAVQGVRDMFKSAEPPRMQGEIKVSVSDDRVRVSQSLSAQGMDATMSSGSGNVFQGAP
jgi:hypothetical protein